MPIFGSFFRVHILADAGTFQPTTRPARHHPFGGGTACRTLLPVAARGNATGLAAPCRVG